MNSIVFVSENNHDIKVCAKTHNGWLLLETVVGISEDLRATLPKPQRDLFLTTEEAWQYAEERANYYRQRIPMTEYDISMLYLDDVKGELLRAINKFPKWPDDPLHALAILVEEVGSLPRLRQNEKGLATAGPFFFFCTKKLAYVKNNPYVCDVIKHGSAPMTPTDGARQTPRRISYDDAKPRRTPRDAGLAGGTRPANGMADMRQVGLDVANVDGSPS